MSDTVNKDLTAGEPKKVLLEFCLPLFGSIIFQQLYNIADSLVAGKFIGNDALAAVGNSYEITLIFIAFAFGCNIGCSVIAARLFGAKDFSGMKTAVYTSLISAGVLCAVLMLMGGIFCDRLLMLIDTPPELMADSSLYLDIYILGLPFVFFYNLATGIFSALGDSKTPFIFLVCSSLANIGADILFVAAFDMGVAGVAWATLICQGVSGVLSVIVVLRRFNRIRTDEKVRVFSLSHLASIAKVAVPSILQQSFISVGNIVIQGAINGFGASAMAGYSASIKLNNMVISAFTTLGNGISSFTAQNMGAVAIDRVKKGFKAGLRMVWTICLPIVITYFTAARWLVYVFLDSPTGDAAIIGVTFLRIVSPFYFVISAKLVADGVLRGAGRMREFMAATLTDLALRVILALVLSKTELGITGIWIAWPICWSIATAMSMWFCKRTMSE